MFFKQQIHTTFQLFKRLSVLIGVLIGGVLLLDAQDPEFSQYYNNPLHLNPALAGTGECTRFIVNFRDQWTDIDDPRPQTNNHAYVSYAASYDEYLYSINGGIGVQFTGDQAGGGMLSTNALRAMYSYRMQLNNLYYIQGGISAALYQRRVDWSKLIFPDQIDRIEGPREGSTTNPKNRPESGQYSILYPDFSAGVFAYEKNNRIYGGGAVKHLTQPNESIIGYQSRLPMRFTLHGGGAYYIKDYYKEKMFVAADVLYTWQDKFRQLNTGLYWSNRQFIAGLWARWNFGRYNTADALIPKVAFREGIFKIAYSYDITISQLGVSRTMGAHEVMVQIRFCNEKKEPVFCPRFY